MSAVSREILEEVLAGTSEPLLVVATDQPDWPIVFSNRAFDSIRENAALGEPFADVIESLAGRELALEVSESIRSQQALSLPIETSGREYLLTLRPLENSSAGDVGQFVVVWRGSGAPGTADSDEMQHALLKAKRRIRDLSRDDAITGLLNLRAFSDVFAHDWAVAAREGSKLSIVVFELDEFHAYLDVFGRHAADSCLRRVGQAIRRCLRRASDVVARADGAVFLVLSHAADESGVQEFARRISGAVRELGLHHPRAANSKFVTVSHRVSVADVRQLSQDATGYLGELLDS